MGAITAWGFQLAYTLFQVPAGMFGERVGARTALMLRPARLQRGVVRHRPDAGVDRSRR